ncbi:MAG TPA: hypothetical protein VE954_01865 [Oligoflexus sp.]|uniref:WD40 repeat domain-containing protein n=1 Tax=Oligoflexus sp. TaxID=1971216 RepID=UPI002D4A9004|nr:hypothetical protein [Oligoflexus sp.]HYX31831.1 hypothetical protein [Oligoflexus sp.]
MNFGSTAFVLTGLILLISGCGQITNGYDSDSLSCGSGHEKQSEFFIATGADGQRLAAADIGLSSLDGQYAQLPIVSRNGCIKKPQAGRYLIKSKEKDWAVIVDADTVAPRHSVQLLDFTGQSLAIQCSESERWAVGGSFSIQSLVKSSFEHALEDAFPVSFELKKDDSTIKIFKNLGLKEAGLLRPFNDIMAEGSYEIVVTTKNLLKEGRDTVKNCKFMLDRTAPDVSFSVNSGLNFSSISIQNTEAFAVVNPSENIEFVSKDPDIKEVRYCLKELYDNFTTNDTEKLIGWRSDTQAKSCDSLSVNSTLLGSPLPFENRSGIWSLRYQAVDTLGNISAPKSTLFIFLAKDKLELIKNLAISDVPLFVLQNKSSQAAASALQAETLRVNLRTQYERDLIKDYTRAGLVTAYDQSGIAIRVDNSDRRVTSVAITKDGRLALAGSWQDKIIQIWDIETRSLLTSIETQDFVSAMAVSPDGRTIYAGLVNGNIETIDKDSKESTVIKSHEREISQLQLSSDGKKLVSGSSDTKIKVWETRNLNLLVTLEEHTKKIAGLALTRDGSRLFSASDDGHMLVWDLNVGKKIGTIESGLTSVNALALGNNEKILAVGSENKIEVMKTDEAFSKFFSIDTKLNGTIN